LLTFLVGGGLRALHPPGLDGEGREDGHTGEGQQTGDGGHDGGLLHGFVLPVRHSACATPPGLVPGDHVCTVQESKTGTKTFLALSPAPGANFLIGHRIDAPQSARGGDGPNIASYRKGQHRSTPLFYRYVFALASTRPA